MKVLYSAKWADGFRCSANAQNVANEIMGIGENATPQQIVELARNKETELHKCFEWNNDKAADNWRNHQARLIVNHLVFVTPEEEEKPEYEVRFFQRVTDDGYKPTIKIMQNEDEYRMLLDKAKSELRTFSQKYHSLMELQPLFDAIEQII